jgi:hypothetical protein
MLDLAASRYGKTFDELAPWRWKPTTSSHVIIGACQGFEGAYENSLGGKFTSALLLVLRTSPLASMSYVQLLQMVRVNVGAQQQPVLAGTAKHSLIFRIQIRKESTSVSSLVSSSAYPAIFLIIKSYTQQVPFDASRTWALIIGINNYEYSRLEGAIHDAMNFNSYLIDDCRVPEHHIRLLLDSGTSRKAMIHALYGLCGNQDIAHGDTIIIYYAGVGSSYHTAELWPDSRSSVEAIVPIDRGCIDGISQVPDISDREINLFLGELAHVKGNNITVILDCSFAGHGTRTMAQHPISSQRRIPPLPGGLALMLDAAEDNEHKHWQRGIAKAHPHQWRPDMSSHVMITACREHEVALENASGGNFTSALLSALRTKPVASASYVQALSMIDYLGAQQSPVVSGQYMDCLIFRIPPHGDQIESR